MRLQKMKNSENDKNLKTIFGENEQLIASAEFNSAGKLDGFERHWSPAGIQILEGSYKNGIRDGKYTTWWDSGEIKESGTFVNG